MSATIESYGLIGDCQTAAAATGQSIGCAGHALTPMPALPR
jgi:hypothetical protein